MAIISGMDLIEENSIELGVKNITDVSEMSLALVYQNLAHQEPRRSRKPL